MAESPQRPRAANIATLEYADSCVQHVSDTLGVTLDVAPFRMPGSNVWQLTIPGSDGRPAVLLTMWTGLKRVDAITGLTTVVINEVIAVDLVPEVEVQFRTKSRGLLIVARKGNVIVRV